MLKILVLIVSSVLLLNAKEYPIQQKIEIEIPLKQSFILEFPFKIDVKKTPFYKMKTEEMENDKKKNEIKIVKPDANGNLAIPIEKKEENTKRKSFTLSSSENVINLFARNEGFTEIVVWGYEKYPIMIKVKAIEDKEDKLKDTYIKFLDYSSNIKEAKKYEMGSHERVLLKLLKALYNNKVPTGFTSEASAEVHESNGLTYTLDRRFKGYNYVAELWAIEQDENGRVALYEEMFSGDNVYLVSLENIVLEEGEVTRLFLIRGNPDEW